jgi:hypothetical protein
LEQDVDGACARHPRRSVRHPFLQDTCHRQEPESNGPACSAEQLSILGLSNFVGMSQHQRGIMSFYRRHTCRRELEAQKCAKRFLNLSWKALSSNEKRSD